MEPYFLKLAKEHKKKNKNVIIRNDNIMKREFALGIPDKNIIHDLPFIDTPQVWEFSIQYHETDRNNPHYDLRLGDIMSGYAHSWAIKNLPNPGEKTLAVRQPTHTVEYQDFAGRIESGYGAGNVSMFRRDKCEVIKSSPDKITFYVYTEATPQKYTLMKLMGDQWLLVNHTITKPLLKYFNTPKLKYKTLSNIEKLKNADLIVDKIDGASSITVLQPEKVPVVYGRKISKKTGYPIEYTPKIPPLLYTRGPKDLGTTVLRTEVYGITPEGKEIPNRILGGILNSNVWKSRELQDKLAVPLRLAAFDVIKYKGKYVGDLPIQEKYKIIDEISKKYPIIDNPLEISKKVPFTEGKVVWIKNQPYKLKNREDFDVYVREIYPAYDKNGKKLNRAGGFKYSLTPRGPIVGNVGTGFTHEELKDMLQHPEEYIGRVAKVLSQEQLPSGALRAPSFLAWHLDK